ncbi:peptide ABC transporter substrate-binding protein [Marinisporobacter balticus]|uniref:Peptide/nickel transport system substrate-binding protein n=1 Tax=Marinisporobacter balticus TaxID=2018667 RepID=A0A4R2L7L1_9FIRM|nr:peptide ABC transporter substrate-binding protein [Marinisporobacter balticus]TCO80006.1 peptide/nickel transport system substrate-binding protein [Marinisporobacter balticus]
MTKEKKIFCCISVLTILLILSGCMDKNAEIKPSKEEFVQIGNPVSGGELIIPVIQFDTLNPILNDNKSVYYLNKLIYDGLITLDEKLETQPALAQTWDVSEDGKEWTFDLRNDIRWHDGKAFTAEDVKFTIEALRMNVGRKESVYSVYVKDINNVQMINAYRITIGFKTPINNAIELFTFPIIPKHKFLSSQDVYNKIDLVPIGTGPYKIDTYDKFKSIKFTLNDDYWGDKPYITSILAKRIPDKEAVLTSVETSEIDVAEATNFDWEKYSEDKSLKIYEYITQDYEFLGFNFRNKILQDKNVRSALGYSIDRHAIVDEVYLGHATVVDVPIHPDAYLYDENEKKMGKDLLKAKKLLKESNWENRDTDPWLENESGQELRLSLLVNGDNLQRIEGAQMIASQLKEIGIDIVINKVNWEEYQKRIGAKQFDIVLSGWRLPYSSNIRFALHSSYVGNTNFISYSNPEMDRLLDEALNDKNKSLRKEKYKQLQNFIVEEVPYFSLYFKNSSIIMKKRVKGDIMPRPFNIYGNIEKWYLLEESK